MYYSPISIQFIVNTLNSNFYNITNSIIFSIVKFIYMSLSMNWFVVFSFINSQLHCFDISQIYYATNFSETNFTNPK